MHRDERNFAEPHEFRPERWMEDPAFNDDLKASQPFHLGPRGCVGKQYVLPSPSIHFPSVLY